MGERQLGNIGHSTPAKSLSLLGWSVAERIKEQNSVVASRVALRSGLRRPEENLLSHLPGVPASPRATPSRAANFAALCEMLLRC